MEADNSIVVSSLFYSGWNVQNTMLWAWNMVLRGVLQIFIYLNLFTTTNTVVDQCKVSLGFCVPGLLQEQELEAHLLLPVTEGAEKGIKE